MIAFGAENEEITQGRSYNAPFLLTMNDNSDNVLSIIIAIAVLGEKGEDLDLTQFPPGMPDKAKEMLLESRPIYADTERVYEIRFDDYIIYQCRRENYTCYDHSEVRKGNYLILFEKSNLLDYYEGVLFDCDDAETKAGRKHYGIYTENNIIDVISNTPPTITKLDPAQFQEYLSDTDDE